jgi:PAS domain S-box-containing protein
VEQASDGIFLCAADGRYSEVNEAWLNMLGYSRDEVLRRDLAAFVDEQELGRTPLRFEHLRTGEPLLAEQRLRRKDGRIIVTEISARMLPGGEILGIVRDITARKKMQSELIELNMTLEKRVAERTAELEAFAYSVSHDLRAPLRHISGFSAIVIKANEGKLDSASVENMGRIAAGAQRMSELIDDLLQLSHVSRQEIRMRTIDLSELSASVVRNVAQADPERDVVIVIAPDMTIDGDPGLMHIVMQNLLANAWKFTSRTARARIEVGRAERDGERIYFVRDNGAGFDMKYAAKLFGAFQRLHSPGEFEGTGIGLSIVQRIVARHDGRIWAEAALGKGATFYFTLGKSERSAGAGLATG